jgi:protein TonB
VIKDADMDNFVLEERARFKNLFILAIVIHIFLLLSWDNRPEKLSNKHNYEAPPLSLSVELKPASQTQALSHTAAQLRKRTISAASHQPKDAHYLAQWQSYVEQFGNEHYPPVLLNQNLQGDLRMMVALNKDGSIHQVNIRQSSGSEVLDQAAIRLVYAAAPFDPLPAEISQDIEILEIIRTWQFRGQLSTS